jgi:predicted phage terminase large subunit-like protein
MSLTTTNPDNLSLAERLVTAGLHDEFLAGLSVEEQEALLWDWTFWRRESQTVPDGMGTKYRLWLFRAGRGSGKTLCGAQTTREMTKRVRRIALVAPTAADVRDVMVEGESGIMSVFPAHQRPVYRSSVRRIDFHNGAEAHLYSAEEPERLRGPQHEWAWLDEIASMPRGREALDNLLLGLRLGSDPWALMTGTPKPLRWLRELEDRRDTVVTRASTYDNVRHLAPGFIADVLERYEGTRLGQQELHAEWLDNGGSVFSRSWFPVVDEPLQGRRIRAWDLAATEPSDVNPDPDWSAGALCVWNPDVVVNGRKGVLQVQHIARWRAGPGATQDRIVEMARTDRLPKMLIEQEPGSSGKALVAAYGRALSGVTRVEGIAPTGPKDVRAELWASLAEQGRVTLLAGDWNNNLLDELDEFPNGAHDDQVDAISLAAAALTGRRSTGRRAPRVETRLGVRHGLMPVTLR